MPMFTVRRSIDAYAVSEALVDAEDAQAAVDYAKNHEEEINWSADEIAYFDARGFVALDDELEEIEATDTGIR